MMRCATGSLRSCANGRDCAALRWKGFTRSAKAWRPAGCGATVELHAILDSEYRLPAVPRAVLCRKPRTGRTVVRAPDVRAHGNDVRRSRLLFRRIAKTGPLGGGRSREQRPGTAGLGTRARSRVCAVRLNPARIVPVGLPHGTGKM